MEPNLPWPNGNEVSWLQILLHSKLLYSQHKSKLTEFLSVLQGQQSHKINCYFKTITTACHLERIALAEKSSTIENTFQVKNSGIMLQKISCQFHESSRFIKEHACNIYIMPFTLINNHFSKLS